MRNRFHRLVHERLHTADAEARSIVAAYNRALGIESPRPVNPFALLAASPAEAQAAQIVRSYARALAAAGQ